MLYPGRFSVSPSVVVEVNRYSDPEIRIAASLRSIMVESGRPSSNHFVSDGGAASCKRLGWFCERSTYAEGPFAPANVGAWLTNRLGGSPIAPCPSRTA